MNPTQIQGMHGRGASLPSFAVLLVALLVSLTVAGCEQDRTPSLENGVCPGCNVILIVSDTLRAQQLGLYGYSRNTSPTLDELGQAGAFLEYATSQAACTYPSAHSLLTSRYPFNFLGGKINLIPDDIPTISEILKASGYSTVGISGSPIVTSTPTQFSQGGFDRGFDVWKQCECVEPDCQWKYTPHASCINEEAEKHLSSTSPLFMYLHYMDAHTPWAAPESTFAKPYDGKKQWVRDGVTNPLERMIYSGGDVITLDPGELDHLIDLYDDEVRYFDRAIRDLLALLEKRDMMNDTIIVVAADHGEEILEHNSVKHCHTLYDTETKTPLIFKIPGVRIGRVPHVAENTDILPTLLDYLGIDATALQLDGVSLRSSLSGSSPSRRYAFSSQNELRSISDGRYHMIYDIGEGEAILFDRETDPIERENLSSVLESKAAALQSELANWIESVEGLTNAEELRKATRISRQTEEHLKAIGYIE